MSDKAKILAAELRGHANSVDDCISVVDDAQGASKHVKLGSEAYGVLCQWLPPIFSDHHDTFDELLKRAKIVLGQDAQNLRLAAADFKTTDSGNSGALEKVGKELWGER